MILVFVNVNMLRNSRGTPVKIAINKDGKIVLMEYRPKSADNSNCISVTNTSIDTDASIGIKRITVDDILQEHWIPAKEVRSGFKFGELGVLQISHEMRFTKLGTFSNRIEKHTKIYYSKHEIHNAKVHVFILVSPKGDKFMVMINTTGHITNNCLRISFVKWQSRKSGSPQTTSKIVNENLPERSGILHYTTDPVKAEMIRTQSSELVIKENIALYSLENNLIIAAMRFGETTYFVEINPASLIVQFNGKSREFIDGNTVGDIIYRHTPPAYIDMGIMRGEPTSPKTIWFTQLLTFFKRFFSHINKVVVPEVQSIDDVYA
jgi:hypothetical protein